MEKQTLTADIRCVSQNGTLNDKYMYGYVVNPNGEVQNAYSSFTSPQFRSPMANSSFVPQSRPGQNLIVNLCGTI